MYSFGELVRAARRQRGWSQRDLAHATGVAQPNLAAIERGQRVPSIGLLTRLVDACGLQIRHELEPRHADVDARVAALLAREPALRSGRAGLAALLTVSRLVAAGARVVVDGPPAARLHGAPVSDAVVERIWCALGDLDRLRAAAKRCHLGLDPVRPSLVEDGDELRLVVAEGDRLRLHTGVITVGDPPPAPWTVSPFETPLPVVGTEALLAYPDWQPADRVAVWRLQAWFSERGEECHGLDKPG